MRDRHLEPGEYLLGALRVQSSSIHAAKSENGLGWLREELEVLLADVRKDLKSIDIYAYFLV